MVSHQPADATAPTVDGSGRRSRLTAIGFFWVAVLASTLAQAESQGAEAGDAAERIVSVGGAVTEIVYALGAEEHLIAVDSTSRHPPDTSRLPNVGYMRQMSAEAILALEPDLVLAEADAGPPAALAQLRAVDVPLVIVPDHPSPRGVLEKVMAVARALGLEDRGQKLSARLALEFAELRERLANIERRPSVLFLLSVGRGAPLAGGRGTSADGIIALAGGSNAASAFDGYKPLSPEAAAEAAPEVLLITERTLRLLGGQTALLARPEISVMRSGRGARLVVMNGLLLLGFGPRTPEAVRRLAAALHPGVDFAYADR